MFYKINHTQAAERVEKCCFLSLVALNFDLDLQTCPNEGPNSSSIWIWCKSVQRFQRYFICKQKTTDDGRRQKTQPSSVVWWKHYPWQTSEKPMFCPMLWLRRQLYDMRPVLPNTLTNTVAKLFNSKQYQYSIYIYIITHTHTCTESVTISCIKNVHFSNLYKLSKQVAAQIHSTQTSV